MSEIQATDRDSQPVVLDAWRDEIQGFYRQSLTELQSVTELMVSISTQLASTQIDGADPRAVAEPSPTPPIVPTATGPSNDAPRLPASHRESKTTDDSQDRLANLKRRLAAQLSGQAGTPSTDDASEPGSTS